VVHGDYAASIEADIVSLRILSIAASYGYLQQPIVTLK